jgi:hypothetical protein
MLRVEDFERTVFIVGALPLESNLRTYLQGRIYLRL